VPQVIPNAVQKAAVDASASVNDADYHLTVTVALPEVAPSVVLEEVVANMHITKSVVQAVASITPTPPINVKPVEPAESGKPVADEPFSMEGLPTLVPGDMIRKMEEVVLPASATTKADSTPTVVNGELSIVRINTEISK
jgi:hypothetical protein